MNTKPPTHACFKIPDITKRYLLAQHPLANDLGNRADGRREVAAALKGREGAGRTRNESSGDRKTAQFSSRYPRVPRQPSRKDHNTKSSQLLLKVAFLVEQRADEARKAVPRHLARVSRGQGAPQMLVASRGSLITARPREDLFRV